VFFGAGVDRPYLCALFSPPAKRIRAGPAFLFIAVLVEHVMPEIPAAAFPENGNDEFTNSSVLFA